MGPILASGVRAVWAFVLTCAVGLGGHPGSTVLHGAGTMQPVSAGAGAPETREVPDVTLALGVVPNELLYTERELVVETGQLVEIVLTNPDQMPHNFVLGTPGSLEAIGAAADRMATQPGAAGTAYVPEMTQVLVKTAMVAPGQSLTFRFDAPAEAGRYPFLCTFPAHWQIMNGTLVVVEGGGGRPPSTGTPPGG